MTLRACWLAAGRLASEAIIGFVSLTAWLLGPWRIGRVMRTVSLPRMREHRLRTSLTVLGIALGVAVLVAVVTVNHSIVAGTTATLDDISGRADLQITAGASGFEESLLDAVRAVPGVFKLTPVTQQIVSARSADGRRERVLILGVDLLGSEESYFRDYASKELTEIRAEPLSFLNSANNIVLGRSLAQRLGVGLHQQVRVTTATGLQEFEVWGFIDDAGIGRAFGGAIGGMYYPAMQVAVGRGRVIDRIDVALKPGAELAATRAALEVRLGPGFGVEAPNMRGERLSKMLNSMRVGLTMASFIALIAGVFLVFNTCAIGVVQRRRELGLVRALGSTRAQLVRMLTLEGALLGFVGSGFGVGFGLAISSWLLRVTARAVNQLYVQQAVNEIRVDAWLVLASFALGIGAASFASRLATQRASGIRPIEALRMVSDPTQPRTGRALGRADWLGVALVALALGLLWLPTFQHMPVGALASCIVLTFAMQVLLPRWVQLCHAGLSLLRGRLGATALLAIGNLRRDLGRTAGMASGLMAGVSLTVCVATFIASFMTSLNAWSDQLLPGDLFVTSGAAVSGMSARNTPMADGLRAELLALPGVGQVRRVRVVDNEYHGHAIKLHSTDVRILIQGSRLTMIEGSEDEVVAALQRGSVAVSENFARNFGVHRGDRLSLSTRHGTRAFPVAGVLVDYSSDVGTVFLDRSTYVEGWGDDRVDTFEVRLAPGANSSRVRSAIDQQLSEAHDLFVLTNREFRAEIVKATDQVFGLLRALEIVTLLVAAMGLMTTILTNVMDRVREIGVLRAVGMRRGQLGAMIMVEAALVGAIGTLAGAVLGCALGVIVLKRVTAVLIGWFLPYRVPLLSMASLAVITLLISALAGLFPARSAARLIVREALDHD